MQKRSICFGKATFKLILAAFVVAVACATVPQAQEPFQPNLVALVEETQLMSKSAEDRMVLVWWLPVDYWEIVLNQDQTITAEGILEILDVVRPYTMLMILDGRMGPFGGIVYRTPEQIRAEVSLVGNDGTKYRPFEEDSLSPDVINFVSMVKPLLSNMLGTMGQNMHMFFFPVESRSGEPIADPRSRGTLGVEVGRDYLSWRLPLNSLLPPKVCSLCNEECKGSWRYCPWCGSSLDAHSEK